MKIRLSDIEAFILKRGLSKDIDIFRLVSLYVESLEVQGNGEKGEAILSSSKNRHNINNLFPSPLPPSESSSKFTPPENNEYSIDDVLNLFST